MEDAENDLRELKVKIWRKEENNREEWIAGVNRGRAFKVMRGEK
jgi:hypothetical protein